MPSTRLYVAAYNLLAISRLIYWLTDLAGWLIVDLFDRPSTRIQT
jgi:hypothetical protein